MDSAIGQNIALIILELRMPDAGAWLACTATPQTVTQDPALFQDFILTMNNMSLQTRCDTQILEKDMLYADEVLWAQLGRDQITFTDMSTLHVVRVTDEAMCSIDGLSLPALHSRWHHLFSKQQPIGRTRCNWCKLQALRNQSTEDQQALVTRFCLEE